MYDMKHIHNFLPLLPFLQEGDIFSPSVVPFGLLFALRGTVKMEMITFKELL